ncbi:hypothetical protein [Fundicoccus culcitae]|uniref:DUF5067 domain-containing protein n=1 Tax=Fundicoccus culcitae TaxID=2969821 RepID=A0ABY5P5I6_9LACT|nr:hypothetical protein [Fundicoccus culcitae]UUX33972.1 hypothetical protein NRE15_13980 [Fundicoccus culcitae]
MSIFNKSKRRLTLMVVSVFFLAACDDLSGQYEQFIQEQAADSHETIESVVSDNSEHLMNDVIDTRLVPEFNQVESELHTLEGIEIGETLFASTQSHSQSQDAFEINIRTFKLFEVDSIDESLLKDFGYSEDAAAVVLIHAAITNTTNETFYFPIEELRLSYRDAPMSFLPSQTLYPSASGNLSQILLQNNGEITAGTMVEGYVVYGLNASALESIQAAESFYLNVVPPRQNVDEIVGLGANLLGNELPLFLPITDEAEEEISLNNTYIQDRLTTEWWGTKTLLAAEDVSLTDSDQDVHYQVEKIEVADFEPFENYVDAFQNFNYGQVIVSVQYTVDNQSQHAILPVDGDASLVIGEDEIKSDYALINQLYGEVLQPGESMTVIKTFALDKMRYYDVWQGMNFYIAINTPIDDSYLENQSDDEVGNESTSTDESTDRLNESVDEFLQEDTSIVVNDGWNDEEMDGFEETLDLLFVQFSWEPVYQRYINDDLDIVSQRDEVPNLMLDETPDDIEVIEDTEE